MAAFLRPHPAAQHEAHVDVGANADGDDLVKLGYCGHIFLIFVARLHVWIESTAQTRKTAWTCVRSGRTFDLAQEAMAGEHGQLSLVCCRGAAVV